MGTDFLIEIMPLLQKHILVLYRITYILILLSNII